MHVIHRTEPITFHISEMFGLAQRQAIDLLADDFTAWIFGFMSAILVIPYFVRLDRGFDFRAVTGPLDRA